MYSLHHYEYYECTNLRTEYFTVIAKIMIKKTVTMGNSRNLEDRDGTQEAFVVVYFCL